ADIIKIAMIDIYKEILNKNYKSKIVLQVHDELLLEVPTDEKEEIINVIRERMENAYPLKVRLKVDIKIGTNWYM
ncbi:unnamed protein product, partial [marine sediment metagenome]